VDWHRRYVQQAGWTDELRNYLFRRAGLSGAQRVLEVGCGTGAVLAGLVTGAVVHALDKQPDRLAEARRNAPQANLVCADALLLPYPGAVFDITFCHFLLLWVGDPLQALREMKRVTRPGGSILALAEPDYSRRVDKPEELAVLGRWQTESLRRQGVDPAVGGRLTELFRQAGIRTVETGSLQPAGTHLPAPGERDLEWAVLEADLMGLVPPEEIQRLKLLDIAAWQKGERVLHVQTYWIMGTYE
jgi:SAM-dependent methyltransferase